MDITQKFRNIVRAIVGLPEDPGAPPQIDRLAWYRATVQAVAADGSTVDVTPDVSNIAGQKNVPVRVGIPGLKTTLSAGSTIMYAFIGGDPARSFVALWDGSETVLGYVFNGPATFNGDVNVQHLSSSQPALNSPPTSGDVHLTIDAGSTDRSGYFNLVGLSASASISIDVSYARPYKNGSRAWCLPVDSAAATSLTPPTNAATPGLMVVYVDAANTDKNKFRVVNRLGAGSTQTPQGKFIYGVEGF